MDKTYALNLQTLSAWAYERARALCGKAEGRVMRYDPEACVWVSSAIREQNYARLLFRRQAAVRGLFD